MTTASIMSPHHDRVFLHLIARFRSALQVPSRQRWLLLEAAHVVGQTRFGTHLQVHCLMLSLACEERTLKEALGQLFRIVLVPLGHLLKRLPKGNSGRADISAFKAMEPSAELKQIIADAMNS